MYRQSEKNLLNSITSSTCPDNMVNFGLLATEIRWRVWGTPANFNGFRVLAALLHGILVIKASAYGSTVGWTPAQTIHTYIHTWGNIFNFGDASPYPRT